MKVTTPVEGFSGSVAGVDFDAGVGETDNPNALNYFRRHGYTVGNVKQEKADDGGEPTKDDAPKAKKAPAKKAPAKKAAAKKAAAKK